MEQLVIDKFWSRVTRSDGCWLWTAAKTSDHYGQMQFNGKVQYAHRISFALTYGEIKHGLFVCHRCDNPTCVRPDHLFLGTHSDNMVDMHIKARAPKVVFWNKPDKVFSLPNTPSARSKLTSLQVEEIRARYRTGMITQKELGKEYGVGQAQISRIIRGEEWVGR
jgi:hypothetical protein